jgi:diguanylate cyclase (GGDEF)-like protein
MIKYATVRSTWKRLIRFHPDRFLHGLAAYLIPFAIAVFSLMALLAWDNHYPAGEGQPLPLRILEQEGKELHPADVLQLLADRKSVMFYDTHLSERPYWFTLIVVPEPDGAAVSVELPSRHASEILCWDGASLKELGHADRAKTHGAFSLVKAGFAVTLTALPVKQTLLCRASFVGPARISAAQWPSAQLDKAERAFHRMSGLLDGGLIVLAMFVLITGIINREGTYVLFAAWLLVNLRMAALSFGGSAQWLGHTVPLEWIGLARSTTLAFYYTLTAALFRSLFREELEKVGYSRLLRYTLWSCVPVMLIALLLPYRTFLPIMWTVSGCGILVVVFFLARILILIRSPVAVWYSASLGVTLVASLFEVISAAVGYKGLAGSFNSVTAALSSSLLAALAIAAQLRIKNQQWLEVQAELQHTYDAMPIGLFTLNVSGLFLSANPAMQTMLGADRIQLGHDLWEDYFSEGAWPHLHRLVHSQSNSELEIRCKSLPGHEQKRFLVKAILARGKIEGSLQDITERSKATEDLQFMANNDPLTKVLNRRGINTVLELAIIALPAGIPVALAYLDLDRFKLINDLYGHSAGDEILKQVCERIDAMLTGGQRIGRVGGDEFVIVFPESQIAAASWVCRGIVDAISTAPYQIGDKAFQVRVSIGLIELSTGTKIKDAISSADRACRDAKSAPDGLVVYEKNAAAFHEREAELKLVERFAGASAPHGLFVDMQPIMSLKNPHASLNFEVLLRMRDTDGSIIPAGRIIPAAEGSGRIGMIDRWVLATVLAWINSHQNELDRTQFVCMNLSGASLNDERFVQDAFEMLEKNRHAASLLCLEITESVALHDLENTRRFIDQVRSCGVRIALDDFGAGYTSFSYLKDLPADVLKIDGSFIVNMNAHPANIAIVEAIVSLATNLGMKTIAEWAEDNATVQTLVEIGVDYVQGYAVARPQTPERILAANSAASFIQDAELEAYAHALSAASNAVSGLPAISLMSGYGVAG